MSQLPDSSTYNQEAVPLRVAIEQFRRRLIQQPEAAENILILYGVDTAHYDDETKKQMIQELTHKELSALLRAALINH